MQQRLGIGSLIDVSLANKIGWKIRQMVKNLVIYIHLNKLFLSPVVSSVLSRKESWFGGSCEVH